MNVKIWDKKEFINGNSPEVIFQEYAWAKYTDVVIAQVGATTFYVDNIDIIKDSLGATEDTPIEEVLQKHKEVLMGARVPEATTQEKFRALEIENENLKEIISTLEDENADMLFTTVENDLRVSLLESDVADLLLNLV